MASPQRSIIFLLVLFTPLTSAIAVDDRAVDSAIVKALHFLADEQQDNGSWTTDGTEGSTAATSLAVMAFLAGGHVPGEGPYGKAIDRGVQFVLRHQESNGMLVSRRGHGPMYDHGISTLMLAEVAGMTPEAQAEPTRKALEKAVRLTLIAQAVRKAPNNAGGWRYQHTSKDSDLSVTAWQLLALRAARDIGCDVPAENIDHAVAYVQNCATNNGFAYIPRQGMSTTMTVAGILALQVCGQHDAPVISKGLETLNRQPLQQDQAWYFYGAYYWAISSYKYGGPDWDRVKSRLFEELLQSQEATGCWQAKNNTEQGHGKTYATSLAVLALTVEYGYLPIYQR